MLNISEYKHKYVDTTGAAPIVLLNLQGESLYLKDVQTVSNINGRLKMRWQALNVPDQWRDYTHIALLKDKEVMYLSEVTPINFAGKKSNLEITFYE